MTQEDLVPVVALGLCTIDAGAFFVEWLLRVDKAGWGFVVYLACIGGLIWHLLGVERANAKVPPYRPKIVVDRRPR